MVASEKLIFLMVFLIPSVSFAMTDKEQMDSARFLYANSKLQEAQAAYAKIPVSSDFWLDSLEESAWAKTRLGNYENALGDLQSITSSIWSSQVSPETYMLSAFVSLKICDYKSVLKKIDLFKTRMLPRVDSLETIINGTKSEKLWSSLQILNKGRLTMASVGNKAEFYPRYFYRDQILLTAVQNQQKEIATERLQALAQADLKEIELNLKKMKVIEVEVMQRVLSNSSTKKTKGNLKFESVKSEDKLVFPVNDDEVWIDEVGKFQVLSDSCAQITSKKSNKEMSL